MTFNVLLSAAGRRVTLARIFKDELRRLDLHGVVLAADASPLSAAFHDADMRFLVPPCNDEAFISTMLRICDDHAVGLVVPTIDPELPVYAEHRERFAARGVTLAVSSSETVAIGYDKVRTHDWLVAHHFPTVRQACAAEVLDASDTWPWPLIVKPRRGSASIGVRRVDTPSALRAATYGGDYVVQTVAPGAEYTVDVLIQRNGRCVCAVPRRRLEVRAGEVSKGITVRNAVIESLAMQVAEQLPGAYGALNIQIFYEPSTSEVSVIEINARFGGGYPLTDRAGASMARWLLEEVAGLVSSASPHDWKEGILMLRFDDAVFINAAQAGLLR